MGKSDSLDSLHSNNKKSYEKYRNANKILHLTATYDEYEIVRNLVSKDRANDDFDYYPWHLACGNLPTDDMMFAEKYVPNLFFNNYSEYDMVVVWHSTDINSLTLFYCMCHRFMPLNTPLYEIDIQSARELFADYYKHVYKSSINTKHCSILDIYIKGLLEGSELQVMQVDKDDMIEYDALWQKLVKMQPGMRILKDDVLVGVSEDYFDNILLSHVPENGEFGKCARVVGSALTDIWESGFHYDSYIYDRFCELAKQGKVELKTTDDFDYKAYRASLIIMEGYTEEEFDNGWLTDILPPMRCLMVRKIDKK